MKTRDHLAIEVMRAIIAVKPEVIKEADHDDGSDIGIALDIFQETRAQIRDKWAPGFFLDDEGEH